MIVRLEKGLQQVVELVWTKTRNSSDPSLIFNPSGRIPFLLLGDDVGFEDTDVIIDYFDNLSAPSRYVAPPGLAYWPFRRAQATARSMLDGVSVWAREILRPEDQQSPQIIEHERLRAERLADYFEKAVAVPPLALEPEKPSLNIPQLILFCALDTERRNPQFDWRSTRPALCHWHEIMIRKPSVRNSLPK